MGTNLGQMDNALIVEDLPDLCADTRRDRQASRAQGRLPVRRAQRPGHGRERAILAYPHHQRACEALAQEHNPTAMAQAGHRLACSLLHSSSISHFPPLALRRAARRGQAAGRGGQRAGTLSDDDFQLGEVGTPSPFLMALSILAAGVATPWGCTGAGRIGSWIACPDHGRTAPQGQEGGRCE